MNINCRSVVEKKVEFQYFTDQTKPDIIVGTESWLTDNHYNSEIFDTDQYSIFRKDRKGRRGGGVFLAIKHSLNPVSQPELDTSAEVIWAKIDIPGLKNVYICSFYKPSENDEDSLVSLRSSLSKIPHSSAIWALGDFNLPNIDWDKAQTKENCSHKSIYDKFFEMMHDFALEQMVKEPTRDNNILDLFLTNTPNLVQSTKTLPPPLGQGDHDIVHHELKITLGRNRQKPRPVKLYKKTDWDGFRSAMEDYQSDYFKTSSNMPVNSKWNLFKTTLNKLS